MATARRRPWHEMDHDHEPLDDEIVHASRTDRRGPIPEFLAKKRAEQAPGTARAYEVAFDVFLRFCAERGVRTVGQISETVAYDFIAAERERGMAAGTIRDRVQRLKTWTRWMRQRGWTERDRWEDVATPRTDPAEFDLIEPELRRAAFAQFDARTFLGARNQSSHYLNNSLERDHGHLKQRLKPMRGFKQLLAADVFTRGHAMVQNLRHAFSSLTAHIPRSLRLAAAWPTLAHAI
jgi:DDE domain/Phage integrase, N-terminal SAM-like domain